MPNIYIPVGVFAPLLGDGRKFIPSPWTEPIFDEVLENANLIWRVAHIKFIKSPFEDRISIELSEASIRRLSRNDQQNLCHQFRPLNGGVSVILVNQAESNDRAAGIVGGIAMEIFRSCLLAHSANRQAMGVYLAHELGHLLGLPDIRTGLGDNLMYGGFATDTRLEPGQRQTALRNASLLVLPRNQTGRS